MEVKISNLFNTSVHVMAQYTDTIVRLLDGFSHSTHSRMTKNTPKNFYYRMPNKKETTIFLENKAGEFKINAKLVTVEDFDMSLLEDKNMAVTKADRQF